MALIIIILVIFITSAALSKIRRAAGTCHSVLTKRCAFRRRAKVAVDSVDRRSSAGKLFQVSGCGCPLHIEFSGGGRPQVSTSSEMNDRSAELSEIRGYIVIVHIKFITR